MYLIQAPMEIFIFKYIKQNRLKQCKIKKITGKIKHFKNIVCSPWFVNLKCEINN